MNKKGLNLLLFTSALAGVFLVSLRIWQGSDSSLKGFHALPKSVLQHALRESNV